MWQDIRRWFHSQPFNTKWVLVLSIVVPLLLMSGAVHPYYVIFHSSLVWRRLQLWRIATAVMATQPSLGYLFGLVMRYQYCLGLETGPFLGRPADFSWFLVLAAGALALLNSLLNLPTLWEAWSMCIVYVWSKHHSEQTVLYMLGLRFRALYLPLVMLIGSVVMGGSPLPDLLGIAVGHVYYFLTVIRPDLVDLSAPSLLYIHTHNG